MTAAPTGGRSLVMVVPGDVDDPARPSGGNTYDQRLRDELVRGGWAVTWRAVAGDWPGGGVGGLASLATALADAPDGSLVLVDGLLACGAPEVVLPETETARLRVVVLVHMPLGHRAGSPSSYAREGVALRSVSGVIATSGWSRGWLLSAYGLEERRVHVAQPGTDPARVSSRTAHGGNLLCVASVVPDKGHDVLLGALSRLRDLTWRCECVGSLERAPDFVERVGRDARAAGLSSRFVLAGARTGDALKSSYDAADLLVLPSRAETWGMVVTEALAHGVPVVASEVGGVPEAMGGAGILVAPDDEAALAAVLGRWLTQPDLRGQLRSAALERRTALPGWDVTARTVAGVLGEVLEEVPA